ncbi:GalNAc-alpha-(1-_4)-GalNAc-alpha-(1-_3)-diNAcBac-PP-undecaprenol alpha-1,4-N-acetyl-D-galactosaminyltransferase [Aequorivita antarctica]|uniref:Glycosyltransferase family 4 protein n=2 Tax=Aequorivita antarctica TaxID=153266 RepID=A0A5C6Z1V8_9FLAO|nr:glycosyltransferase family 4 protein [Aequorivita antarctica]SRX75860.1 GalNAc-alpha-(1->4)-GalNAc-alpha-(1->3)-diNAcBac-PP-undecaprenol alpha-1,4-N-acetyl-D-galactosaminyltransferase [Aequorivita antarctica]
MEQRKKIYFFTMSLAKGGAENQLVRLALYYKKKGYEVTIIQTFPENDFVDELTKNQIDNLEFRYNSPNGIRGLFSFIKKNRPDVIISFMFAANLVARAVKFRFKTPIITSVRSEKISKLYNFLYRISYKIDDFTVFNSAVSLSVFREKHLTLQKKSIYIPNAIIIDALPVLESKNSVFTLISIAHFRPAKDYKTLFEAIKILNDQNVPIKLIVLGKTLGQEWPDIFLEKLGIKDLVEIKGYVPYPKEYFSKVDALVLSTFWEGTPNAILEAMANKLPIISTDITVCNKLITNAKCGFLSAPQDALDLSLKIQELMALPETEREMLGTNGYNYTVEHYSENIVYEQWEKLIDNLL